MTMAEYAESGNEITKEEQTDLQQRWDAITQKGLDIRNQVAAFTGYTAKVPAVVAKAAKVAASRQ